MQEKNWSTIMLINLYYSRISDIGLGITLRRALPKQRPRSRRTVLDGLEAYNPVMFKPLVIPQDHSN